MKKFFSSLMLMLICQLMLAGTMPTTLHTVKLQDGRTVQFSIMGTTEFSWLQTTTGEYIVQDGNTYRSATVAENKALQQSLDSLAALHESQNAAQAKMAADAMQPTNDEGIADGYAIHVGSPKIAVILVNFKDSTMQESHDQAYWHNFFNSTEYTPRQINTANSAYMPTDTTNYGSVRQYFSDMSNGQFTPDFEIFGPFTIDGAMNNYINDNNTNYLEMAKAACVLADSAVDFSQYDFTCLIVPKYYYQYTGNEHYINAKTCHWATIGKFDGKIVNKYFVGAELGMTPNTEGGKKRDPSMGIICHEYCHALGLPDLYPYSYWTTKKPTAQGDSVLVYDMTKYDNQSMEHWDLMDGGEHIGYGYCPMPLSYFERWLFGWVDAPGDITEDGEYTLSPLVKDNAGNMVYNPARRIVNPADSQEYWILENIPRNTTLELQNGAAGWYRAAQSYGMLVTHISSYSRTLFQCGLNPNNKAGEPHWTIIPADSVLYSSYHSYCRALFGGPYDWWFIGSNFVKDDHRTDTYPLTGTDNKSLYFIKTQRYDGKYNYTYLKNDSIPAERLNAQTATDGLKAIHHIKQDGGNNNTVTFIYGDDTPTAITEVNATDEKFSSTIKYIDGAGNIIIVKNGQVYNLAGIAIGH